MRTRRRSTLIKVGLELDRHLWAAVRALATREGVTLQSLTTAALVALLRAHTQEVIPQ